MDIEDFLEQSSIVVFVILTIIYPLRLCCLKGKLSKTNPISKINHFLRKIHIPLAVSSIIIVLLHCRFSDQWFELNIGTVCLLFVIFLLLTYLFRKKLKFGEKNKINWMVFHRFFTAMFWILIVAHILIDG